MDLKLIGRLRISALTYASSPSLTSYSANSNSALQSPNATHASTGMSSSTSCGLSIIGRLRLFPLRTAESRPAGEVQKPAQQVHQVVLIEQIKEYERHRRGRKRRQCKMVAIRLDFNRPLVHIEEAQLPCTALVASFDFTYRTYDRPLSGSVEIVLPDNDDQILKQLLKRGKLYFDADEDRLRHMLGYTYLLLKYLVDQNMRLDPESKKKHKPIKAEDKRRKKKEEKPKSAWDKFREEWRHLLERIESEAEFEKELAKYSIRDLLSLLANVYVPKGYSAVNETKIIRESGKSGLLVVVQGKLVIQGRGQADVI